MFCDVKDIKLIPFYLSTIIFFIFVQPFADYPEQTITSAILKALPIWSLAFYVYSKTLSRGTNEHPYPSAIFVGLLLSSLGDILIIWHDTIFNLGVAIFAVAHAFYLIGLKSRYKGGPSSWKLMYTLIVLTVVAFVMENMETHSDKVLCIVYFSLLGYLAWMASAHYENEKSTSSFYVMTGTCLFLFSDSIILIDRVMVSLRCFEVVVMATYYASQWSLAISTVPT